MPLVPTDFSPLWWLRNPHLQTLWASRAPRRLGLQLDRERLELPDGDFVDLHWIRGGEGPVVCLLHGLQGSAKSSYVQGLLTRVQALGWRGVVMEFRGCSPEPNRKARSYHLAETEDPAFFFDHVRQRFPDAPLFAVGFSLGANALLCYLGERGKSVPVDAAVAISPPLVPALSTKRLDQGFSRVYRDHFVKSLQQRARLSSEMLVEAGVPLEPIFAARNLVELDGALVAPLNGFRSAAHYYEVGRSRRWLPQIALPTLIVSSVDDPVCGPEVIPPAEELSPMVELETTQRGGHVGFLSGTWRPRYWLEERIPQWLQARFAELQTRSSSASPSSS